MLIEHILLFPSTLHNMFNIITSQHITTLLYQQPDTCHAWLYDTSLGALSDIRYSLYTSFYSSHDIPIFWILHLLFLVQVCYCTLYSRVLYPQRDTCCVWLYDRAHVTNPDVRSLYKLLFHDKCLPTATQTGQSLHNNRDRFEVMENESMNMLSYWGIL